MAVERFATEMHDIDAELPAFLKECEEAFRRDHEVTGQIDAEVSHINGPGPLFTVTAVVRYRS